MQDQDSEETKNLKDRFAKLAKDVAFGVDYNMQIREFETNHTSLMLTKYGNYVLQFETEFALLSHVVDMLNYHEKSRWGDNRNIQYLFIVHNIKVLFSAFDRVNKGFAESSLILMRSVYEAMIYIVYLSCYPDRLGKVLNNKPFGITCFIEDELKLIHWRDYGILSTFAHGNKLAVYKDIYSEKRKVITMKYEHDEKSTQVAMNYFVHAMYFFCTLC